MKEITKRISYAELSDRLDDYILCNNIQQADDELIDNLHNGSPEYCYIHDELTECAEHDEDCEYEYYDIYQSYLISPSDAEYLSRHTDEIIYYSPLLDLYVWGVTHFGTSWSGVHLDFKEEDYNV